MTETKRPAKKIHGEMLVGVSAVVIGICALGVSLYETSLMREEQRAAVMPLLELSRSYNLSEAEGKSRLYLQAQNVGIGPAKVVDFKVTVDGKAQPTWEAAIRALTGTEDLVSYGQSTINGRTIPADRIVTMMNLNSTEQIDEIMAVFDRLDFEACYCSIFDECWTTRFSAFGAATEVQACMRSDESFNE